MVGACAPEGDAELKVIVLGGAGLIGRAVVRDLAEQRDVELTSEFAVFEPGWTVEGLLEVAMQAHPGLRAARADERAANAGSRAAPS